MKSLSLIIAAISLTACGLSASDNELVGQVKKVIRKTPIVCPDYDEADISLGVVRNGVGSMSHEDVTLYVTRADDSKLLKRAAETGLLVKVTYDVQRVGICRPSHWLMSVTAIDAQAEAK